LGVKQTSMMRALASANDPRRTYGHLREARLEQPGQAALDGVVLQVIGELAGIREASHNGWIEIEVEPRIDQRTVSCERHAGDVETGAHLRKTCEASGMRTGRRVFF
jgi:hypothetical protein